MTVRNLLLAATVTAVMLSGCSRTPDVDGTDVGITEAFPTAWEQPELPAPLTGVDQTSVDAVGRSVVQAMFGWDFQRDSSMYDAIDRARPLMTPALNARIGTTPQLYELPGRQFDTWVDHKAHADVDVREGSEPLPAAHDRTQYRQYVVSIAVHDDAREQPARYLYIVRATLEELGWWKVSHLHITGGYQPQQYNSDEK